jgi:hypothetical protein
MRHQPFWACRCFRSELRRIIRAFAIRTASALGVCFFDSRVFVSVSAVGIMRNCMAAIEPCSTGCTLMGPVDVDLFLGIIDNALLPRSFDGPFRYRMLARRNLPIAERPMHHIWS